MPMRELLQTKLQRPRVPHNYVPRPRLLARLDQGAQGPLTLVCAAAGYGKTTLVSAWLESLAAGTGAGRPQPAAWLSLDARDSDLGLFLRYFIAALRTVFPDACTATLGLLQAPRQAPADVLCATLSNEIAWLPQEFIIVLDDHHAITSRTVPDLLSELERYWPQPLHLVLISRYMPALSLPSLRAKGQLTEIRTRDLRFRQDEMAAYLGQALPGPLSRTAVEVLERQTEGWIAGVQLASLSLRDAEDPEALVAGLSGRDVEFADYLADDVLAHQPPTILSFLMQTSVLDHFCASLGEAVVSFEDSQWSARQCLDWLERRNLFLIALDGHKEWYRYHHMFGDMLLQRAMAELGPGRVADLQCRAAGWFGSRGLVEEALRYALAAGDRELAAQFVVHGLRDALNREDRPTLERWLGLFPDDFVQERPDLLIVKAFSLNMSWQLAALARVERRARALLEGEMNATLPEAEARSLRGCLALLSAMVAYFGHDPRGAAKSSREALALLPEAWLFARGGATTFQVAAMQAEDQGQAAVRLLIENYESLGDRTTTYALRQLLALCLVYYRQAEDLARVAQTAQRLVEGAEQGNLPLLQSWGHHFLGLAHYQRNELAAARRSFARLLDYKYTGAIAALRDGLQRLALIQQIAGEQAQAWETLQLLTQLDLDQTAREADETSALRASLWLMRGELGSAARWADDFTVPMLEQPWPWQDPPHLIRAQVLVARGTAADLQSALETLHSLCDIVRRGHNVRLKIQVLALRALALGSQGKAGEARDALRSAVELARPGGFLRVFLDLGPRMEEALGGLAKGESSSCVAMTRRILTEFGNQWTGVASAGEGVEQAAQISASGPAVGAVRTWQPLIEPLTPRELEILTLLRDPMSLKEMARRLFISYHTARRHTINIYAKLDVNKRWAAVAKAEALGLIPPR